MSQKPTATPAAASEDGMEPILVSLRTAAQLIDLSEKTVTRLIALQKLEAVKIGANTRVYYQSLKRLAAQSPKATFRDRIVNKAA